MITLACIEYLPGSYFAALFTGIHLRASAARQASRAVYGLTWDDSRRWPIQSVQTNLLDHPYTFSIHFLLRRHNDANVKGLVGKVVRAESLQRRASLVGPSRQRRDLAIRQLSGHKRDWGALRERG